MEKKLLSWFVEKDILYFVFTIIIFLLLQMVKCFWPLKDLNVLVEMLFVTVENAIQGHNLQARHMCPIYQEMALQGFWTVNVYGVGPQTATPVRASHLQCSQFWLSALKPPHIYPLKLIYKIWSIFLSICVAHWVILPFLVIFLTIWIKSLWVILGLHLLKIFSSNITLNCMTIVVYSELS